MVSDMELNWHSLEINIKRGSLALTKLCPFSIQCNVHLLGSHYVASPYIFNSHLSGYLPSPKTNILGLRMVVLTLDSTRYL